ncbi:hypothetical protein HPB49_007656 [Dermacentor silvarum]|uniref:Uncharacterized protein n=1 Tax=Dermacentor silvarum TaxID=543639 RepID=A0ACB8C2K3_DERSI|nr:hypothetical protein HPB49_007656 [Dermacentor silvarum]
MTDRSAQRGYDPDAMAWATIPVPEGQQSAAADPIRNEELFRMVGRRSQRNAMKMAPSAPPAGKAPSTQTGSATRAAQGSGAKRSKPTTTWKPKPLPRPHPEDFVVIIKPREPVALRDVFQRGALGAAFVTLVGVQKAATLNLLLSPEQNLIIASTREAQTAEQLLGDFELQTDKGKMAAHGHLKQHGEDVCYWRGHGRQPRDDRHPTPGSAVARRRTLGYTKIRHIEQGTTHLCWQSQASLHSLQLGNHLRSTLLPDHSGLRTVWHRWTPG